MTLVIVLIVVSAILFYLLFLKMELIVDTANNEYYVQAKGLAKAKIVAHETELIQIKIYTLFMKFSFFPLKKSKKKKKKPKTDKAAVRKSKTLEIQRLLRIARTFKVDQLLVDLDTGNCITNAKLFPSFAFFNYYGGQFRVNFEGRNRLLLKVQNRPIRIIKSFINF
ncbi:MAG: hypothetical protein GY931_01585 [Maribacter sp.]|nr:hypothetical protein [Maribacter sp.]